MASFKQTTAFGPLSLPYKALVIRMADEEKNIEAETAEVAQEAPAEEVKTEPIVATAIVPGMVIRVHQKVKEGERERVQIFEGTVIAAKGHGAHTATITVRKVSGGVGVERIFPIKSPNIAKIEVVRVHRVRRAKLYYVRTSKKHLKDAVKTVVNKGKPKAKKSTKK